MNVVKEAIRISGGSQQSQFFLINLLKAGAAQFIVLHHLAFYGPMSDVALPLMPELIAWLDAYGRLAVQVFLVIGGFLAAKSLSPDSLASPANPLQPILRRYLKLAPPFIAAMLLAIGASALAATWMTHDSISAPPDWAQLAAHALLLHDVLQYESLSAGAWYVAIDFQLYALMVTLLWACNRLAAGNRTVPLIPAVVAAGICASLFHFNRDAEWDAWAPYFFGSYGLGALAWWASDHSRTRRDALQLVILILVPAALALAIDFRSRIALALAVSCLLFLFGRARLAQTGKFAASVNHLEQISYAVFLVHFPVCLVVNAGFTRYVEADPYWQAGGMLVGWLASVGVGALFYRWVQAPLGALLPAARASACKTPAPAAPVPAAPLAASRLSRQPASRLAADLKNIV